MGCLVWVFIIPNKLSLSILQFDAEVYGAYAVTAQTCDYYHVVMSQYYISKCLNSYLSPSVNSVCW